MIDVNATFDKHDNIVSELSRGSQKLVVAVCDECDKVRDVKFRNYRNLCRQCAQKSPDVRAKKSGSMMGKNLGKKKPPRTEEHTKNQAEAQRGRQKSAEEILNIKRAAQLRPPVTEETKQNMSNVRKGVPKTDETRTRMSSAKMEYHPHRGVPMTLEERIGQSCGHQKITVDDWDGFVAGIRDHVLPIHMCTKINEWFMGCEGHHLARSLVVFIPSELHNHIWHNMKTGLGMAEMNALSLQFAF